MSTKTLKVSCHCGASNHSFTVPNSSLPLPSNLCSCDISRRISGTLLTSYINITHPIPSSPTPPKPNLSSLTCYPSSIILNRWFCTTCGTHMFLEYLASGNFWAATGTLQERETQGLVRYESCMWIEDTGDGGASQFVREIRGQELARWTREARESEAVRLDWRVDSRSVDTAAAAGEKEEPVYAHCHCRGVEFWIQRPNEASRTSARSPWPDLLIPYFKNKSENPSNHPWWLPNKGTRYLAGTCTCSSCRGTSGFDITCWAFVPAANIFLDSSLIKSFPEPNNCAQWGKMKLYKSSPGVTRSFCSTCGANIFWQGSQEQHGRQGLIDVAVGLLDAPSGARAQEILAWWPGRVSFAEEGINRALTEGLESGLKEWSKRNERREWVACFDKELLKE